MKRQGPANIELLPDSREQTQSTRLFRSHLAAAKRRTRFIYGMEAAAFANELRADLSVLNDGNVNPRRGVELVAEFFRSDEAFFNRCDDSNGNLGDVFRVDACDLFARYAAACDEKQWLAELVLQLLQGSDYGVRECLIDAASQYLPEPVTRDLVDRLWALARAGKDEYQQRHWLYLIKTLARQLGDPALFERAARAAWPDLGPAAYIDIAGVYFASDDAETALKWLKKIPLSELFEAERRDELLLAVYQTLGEKLAAEETAWRIFRRCRTQETFEQLLKVIGSDQRQAILDEETSLIIQAAGMSFTDAEFLIWSGNIEAAERYMLSRANEIDGNRYYVVLPLADTMEREERFLVATLLYRSLLESILARAISKYYGHGVRYLRKLDILAARVENWRDFTPHKAYFLQLLEKHQRKSSFWRRYEKKGSKGRRKNEGQEQ